MRKQAPTFKKQSLSQYLSFFLYGRLLFLCTFVWLYLSFVPIHQIECELKSVFKRANPSHCSALRNMYFQHRRVTFILRKTTITSQQKIWKLSEMLIVYGRPSLFRRLAFLTWNFISGRHECKDLSSQNNFQLFL